MTERHTTVTPLPLRPGARRGRRLRAPHQVDVETIRRIVAIDDARLRNHEITLGYWKLGRELAVRLDHEDTNWCTWATWASRTVGHALDPHEEPILMVERTRKWPAWLRRVVFAIARASRSILNPRMAGAIAEGNREIFAEIGEHFAALIAFIDSGRATDLREVEAFVEAIAIAADSGGAGEPFAEQHRQGLRAYLDAVREPDPGRRSDLILLGNLLMAEYEQARLQPWIEEAFFVRSKRVSRVRRALQRLIGPFIASATTQYVTAVVTPNFLIPVAEPIRLPVGEAPHRTTGTIAEVESTITRLRDGARLPCRSWPNYPTRMASIAAMFCAYHAQASLDGAPYSDIARAELEMALAARRP